MIESKCAVFYLDTNAIFDIWQARSSSQLSNLLRLIISQDAWDLILHEPVLAEFVGSAHRWIRQQRALLESDGVIQRTLRVWDQIGPQNVLLEAISPDDSEAIAISDSVASLRASLDEIRAGLDALQRGIEPTLRALREIATEVHGVPPGARERGMLRRLGLSTHPPCSETDCVIAEGVLSIARADTVDRRRFFLAGDRALASAFRAELQAVGVEVRGDYGALIRELMTGG